ncbi:hypothetical protein CLOM_g3700 [Closterium sp. NIES-68]|nr:hypothetical protein CLOM_g3700 [Closterium sp. NIES-68]GJP82197.1 hypothetical protein CLOP_g12406 [Closterium sp. NIES-67]
MMDVSTVEDALARLVKRHDAIRAKELAVLDKVQHALAQAQAELQAQRSTEHAGGVAERGEKEETIGTSADVAMVVSDDVSKPSISPMIVSAAIQDAELLCRTYCRGSAA